MPSMRGKFIRLQCEVTRAEWERISSEAYSREISRGEIVRRALVHYFACMDTRIEDLAKPPRKWRMSRSSA